MAMGCASPLRPPSYTKPGPLAQATDIGSKLRVVDPLGKVQCGASVAQHSELFSFLIFLKLGVQHKLLELFPQQNHWHHIVDDEDTD